MAVVTRTVLCCAIVCAGASAISDDVSVKQQVEKIFKTVEQYMTGKIPEVTKTPELEEETRIKDATEVLQDPPPAPKNSEAEDRAFVDPVSFPIGVIMSDNLYPLVVGKHVDSGMPFVMNLNQQHALVVARADGGDYRMVIPFPVVMGAPPPASDHEEHDESLEYRSRPPGTTPREHDESLEYRSRSPGTTPREHDESLEYRSRSPGTTPREHDESLDYRNRSPGPPLSVNRYLAKPSYHSPYPTQVHKKYPFGHQSSGKYYSDESTPAYGHSRGPKKYTTNYHSYRDHSGTSAAGESRGAYSSNIPGKYYRNSNYYRNYYGEDRRKRPEQSDYVGQPTPDVESHPRSSPAPNRTSFRSPKEQYTYFVEGPKYHVPPVVPKLNTYSPILPTKYPQVYRSSPTPHYPSSHQHSSYSSEPHSAADDHSYKSPYKPAVHHFHPPSYRSAPEDFKPSPYVGNITDDESRDQGLQPQSEILESYDDVPEKFTEQDYLDSIRDSPESHSSSGVVRHVTHHVDDYLGKIYEDMYYRLPPPESSSNGDPQTQSRSRERLNTEHHVSGQTTDEESSPSYEAASTTYRLNTTETPNQQRGPVTFHSTDQAHLTSPPS